MPCRRPLTAPYAIIELLAMNNDTQQRYWRSPTERDATAPAAAPLGQEPEPYGISRRRFLEAAGFTLSITALSGCGRAPVETAHPLVVQPPGMTPGRALKYATTCSGCPAGCGLLATVRDGRPLKMEGLPEHPLSRGGLCAVGQALPLGLYDSHRLQGPRIDGTDADWKRVDRQILQQLKTIQQKGGAVRFVTNTVTSPTLKKSIDDFLSRFADARHVVFDAVSCSAILDAHEQTHGTRLLPRYRFDQAEVIVSFGADFLGTWISPVEFTAGWRAGRVPTAKHPEMSYHVQFEGRMSLTGSNADRRYRLTPDEYGEVLSALAFRIARLAGKPAPQENRKASAISDDDLIRLAEQLWNARKHSIVLSDHQDLAVQVLINEINELLGNYGHTLDLDQPSRQRGGNDRDVLALIEELKAGRIAALLVAGTDLTHNLPGRDELAKAIGQLDLTVSFSDYDDDFTSLARFVCPDHHSLESWLDAEPVAGIVSLRQPLLAPLGNTRSILESLARWSGRDDETAHDILKSHWQESILTRTPGYNGGDAELLWDQALHDGFVLLKPEPKRPRPQESETRLSLPTVTDSTGYTLILHPSIGIPDSRHAQNPWLQELPDPVTKVTWDNYVSISDQTAKELDLRDGDVVQISAPGQEASLELPVLIQPGQHERVLSIALGYGVRGTDRFSRIGPQWFEARPTVEKGDTVGRNAAGLIAVRNGRFHYSRSGISLEKTSRRHELASTQEHHRIEVPAHVAPRGGEQRDIIQETTLAAFAADPRSGTPDMHHALDEQLWPDDHPKTGHWWGMAIDLNACTGCSACLIACQSENNVPVVGKDEIARQREMHWIRIDRYYSGDDGDLEVLHQPMMCQHCDNAPCETVCPVLATVHSAEGLNAQAYNRCVGTRYCANNCPYKVRRFNWFEYPHEDQLQNLALNPDVTVRSRGVMEKCSMCVQRIEEAKIESQRLGAPLADGRIQTACQQSCPAQAIVFGDMNDPDSAISQALLNPRRYGVLEEFNFRPSVSYLRVVRNRPGETGLPEHGADHHDAVTGGDDV